MCIYSRDNRLLVNLALPKQPSCVNYFSTWKFMLLGNSYKLKFLNCTLTPDVPLWIESSSSDELIPGLCVLFATDGHMCGIFIHQSNEINILCSSLLISISLYS